MSCFFGLFLVIYIINASEWSYCFGIHYCDKDVVCNGHGTCELQDHCQCKENWCGDECEKPCVTVEDFEIEKSKTIIGGFNRLDFCNSKDLSVWEYLNPTELSNFLRRNVIIASKDNVEVYIYTNGLYEVVPNPYNRNKVDGIRRSYEMGLFISYKIVQVPKSFFQNPSVWNS